MRPEDPVLSTSLVLCLGLLSLMRPGEGAPDFDGSGAADSREQASSAERSEPKKAGPVLQGTLRPRKTAIKRRESKARDVRAGRQVRPALPGQQDYGAEGSRPKTEFLVPVDCEDINDPRCRQERKYPEGNPPKGGFYYGWFRGEDGELRYGKLYLPHYGDPAGSAHNDPPALHDKPVQDSPVRILRRAQQTGP